MKISVFQFFILGFLLICKLSSAQAANEFQSLDALENAAQSFIQSEIEYAGLPSENTNIQVSKLDRRIRLKPCETPLEAQIDQGNINHPRLSVKVSCQAPVQWAIRLPVRIERYLDVLVATTPITRGEALSENNVSYQSVNVNKMNQYIDDFDELTGKVAKRHIRAGTVIRHGYLKYPQIISKGDTVQIVARSNGFEVKSQGVAQENGTMGDLIKIKNPSSRRTIHAVVTGPNQVQVHL